MHAWWEVDMSSGSYLLPVPISQCLRAVETPVAFWGKLQSRSRNKPLKFSVGCPQDGTEVKELKTAPPCWPKCLEFEPGFRFLYVSTVTAVQQYNG